MGEDFPKSLAGQSFFINIPRGWFHPLPGAQLSPWLIRLHKQGFIFGRDLCSTPSLVSLPCQTFPISVQTCWTKIRCIVPPIFKIVLLACVFYFCWWQPPCPSPTQAVIQTSCLRVSPSPHLAWLWQSVTRSFGACPCKFFLIFFFHSILIFLPRSLILASSSIQWRVLLLLHVKMSTRYTNTAVKEFSSGMSGTFFKHKQNDFLLPRLSVLLNSA